MDCHTLVIHLLKESHAMKQSPLTTIHEKGVSKKAGKLREEGNPHLETCGNEAGCFGLRGAGYNHRLQNASFSKVGVQNRHS